MWEMVRSQLGQEGGDSWLKAFLERSLRGIRWRVEATTGQRARGMDLGGDGARAFSCEHGLT